VQPGYAGLKGGVGVGPACASGAASGHRIARCIADVLPSVLLRASKAPVSVMLPSLVSPIAPFTPSTALPAAPFATFLSCSMLLQCRAPWFRFATFR
jgi:hypothetical protein